MFDVTFEDSRDSESAFLLEVGRSGGLLQVDHEVPSGAKLSLLAGGHRVCAQVRGCSSDDFGYLLNFEVDANQSWFPEYRPARLLPRRSAQAA
jgi:hypothetical protein